MILRNSSSVKPENINSVYDHIVGKSILLLIIQVGNTSNLILDPDFDRYYAMDTVITKMPELMQLIGQANAHATGLILTRENSESKKQLIAFILARIDPASETINNGLQTALNENPSLPCKLSSPFPSVHTSRRYRPSTICFGARSWTRGQASSQNSI